MQRVKFPLIDYEISPISLGGAGISGEGGGYGFGKVSEEQAIKLLHQALDLGINVLDTAPIYGFGMSEERMGKALKGRREQAFLVSKSGIDWHENKRVNLTNDPLVTERMLNESLKRLQTDYIDLYMIHWPDPRVDISEPMKVLAKAKEQGKIKHIGLSNTNKEDFLKANEVARVEVLQGEFNLFQTKAKEELFPLIREYKLGMMTWGTLEKGIITGSVTRDRKFEKEDARSSAPWWKAMDTESRFKAMERINPILKKANHTGLELALAFNLSFPEVTTVLCGAKSTEQLAGLLKAYQNLPENELVKECVQIVKEELNS